MHDQLVRFARISRNSPEYQGHGWGCAWLDGDGWRLYHDIRPVWEHDFGQFGETTLLLAHARSAFRDEGIRVENNMPFYDGEQVFVFNGELRGVRIRERGRIGAEKVFNYIKRFDRGDRERGLGRALDVIAKRSRYVRALNLIMGRPEELYLASRFNENPGYFQMWRRSRADIDVVCSAPYPGEGGWSAIDNGALERLQPPGAAPPDRARC